VLRKSRPVGLKRYENSGEHSWHVCISALMLKDYANTPIDIDRVIKMLLIHDLGEIDAGDKIVYDSDRDEDKINEKNGMRRLLGMLPADMGEKYLALWDEFEAVPPLLHNINDDGHGWKENNISKEKVFDLNSKRISTGSSELWGAMEAKLEDAVKSGILT